MTTAIAKTEQPLGQIESVMIKGDLSSLNENQRLTYYKAVCDSVGLNPLTAPFNYITLNGKLVLYAKKDATEQLRSIHDVSIESIDGKTVNDVYVVTAKAKNRSGRVDSSTGAVNIKGLSGDALANALMKAECVPLDYEILTRDGFKSALDLEIGEPVAAMDPQTQAVEWVPLQDISIFENQRVTKFGNSAVEFEITPGHSWATESNNGVRGLKPFEQIKSGTYLVLAGKMKGGSQTLSPQEAASLGLIVTDGTIKKYKGKPYRASVCQGKSENFDFIEWALAGIGRVTKAVTDNRAKGWLDQHWWHLSKAQTQALFEKAGYTGNEDLPKIVAGLCEPARDAMLEAMMRADGDKRGNFGKTKKEVIEAFQILCALSGHLTSKTRMRLQEKSTKPIYLVRKMSYNKTAFQNLEEQESRETTVWCPTTKYGTWICRTDSGQVMVTGNTKAKRRVTLSICGLGLLDETELETIPELNRARITPDPGEPIENFGVIDDKTYRIGFGQWRGRSIEEVYRNHGPEKIMAYIQYLEDAAKKKNVEVMGAALEFIQRAEEFLGAMENKPHADIGDDIPAGEASAAVSKPAASPNFAQTVFATPVAKDAIAEAEQKAKADELIARARSRGNPKPYHEREPGEDDT